MSQRLKKRIKIKDQTEKKAKKGDDGTTYITVYEKTERVRLK